MTYIFENSIEKRVENTYLSHFSADSQLKKIRVCISVRLIINVVGNIM